MHPTLFLLFFFISEYGAVPLLMSMTRRITVFDDSDPKNGTSLTTSADHVVAVDYHLARGEVYFTEATGQIFRSRLRPDETRDKPTIIAEIKTSDGIAVDWIHDNLYWTDIGRKTLEVATLDGLHRTVLFNASHGLEKPRAIVLDPSRGLLFWSDWGDDARVESSGLDGKQIKTIINSNLHWPNGLALDLSRSKIYILDGYISTVSSCNYDGSDFKVLSRSQDNFLQAFGLTMYGNTLYWHSWRSRTLFKTNTITWHTTSLLEHRGLEGVTERMMGLKAVHTSLQPKSSTPDPCKVSACSHWCLISRDLTPTCFCPFGYKLSTDNKTCIEEGYLIVSWRRTIRRFNMDGDQDESLIDTTKAAISISYHLKKGLVFWSDIEEHRIYRAPLDQFNNKTVIATPEACDGLAVDWIHDILYWTDTNHKTLEASQLDGSKHMIIFNNDLDQPRDIALDPFSGLMFWTDWGTKPRLERSTLDGLERKVIVDDIHVWPNGITIDIEFKKIYWVDGKLETILSSSYDGNDSKVIFTPQSHITLQLFSITHLKDELFWTDWNTKALYRSPKDEITVAKRIASSPTILLRPNGVKAVHSSLQKTKDNPCAAIACQSLCLGSPLRESGARCMGEETPGAEETLESESVHPELIKTAFNDSIEILLTKAKTPPTIAVIIKCLGRDGCKDDTRCLNQFQKSYLFHNTTSYRITDLLPASHYEVNFITAKVVESFNIITTVTDPPEIPEITSVEKQDNKVTVKWDPVDTCVPGFLYYHYKLFKTAVENEPIVNVGSTNLTEVVFDKLEPEVSYTAMVYTYDPNHFSTKTFNLHRDVPPECLNPNLVCNGKADCPDASDEEVTLCAGIEKVIVYMKSKSEVHFRIDVTNGTKNQLDKFVVSCSSGNKTEQFDSTAERCLMWPESYCLHSYALQQNAIYDFKIAAALKDGQVGNKFTISAITKEEASGPPEGLQVFKRNTTSLELQWHHPYQSNGIIKNFIINIDQTDSFEEGACCQAFPIIESPVSSEETFYEIAITGCHPASTYALSIAAKNMYLGSSATIVTYTPPPPMEVVRIPKVEVSSLLPLSWQPGEEPGELPVYHNLIRSYMLLLLPPKNEPLPKADNNDHELVKELLKSKLGDRFVVLWHKKVEETAAFQNAITVSNLTVNKQYRLAWAQVSQYNEAYSIDLIESDPFITV